MAKFNENVLNLGDNIARSFRGYFFDSHCISDDWMDGKTGSEERDRGVGKRERKKRGRKDREKK